MTEEEAKRIIEIEKSCVMRNEGRQCNRDCGKCDLVLDTFSIIEAYNFALKTIKLKTKYRKMAKRFKRKYIKLKSSLDDAISRQATIEAFQMFRGYEANRTNAEWVDRIETVVKKLPSVNPQEPKTIQEKQAESEKYQKAFDDGYANGYTQARFDYEQEPNTGNWIPVTERLPEDNKTVIASVEYGVYPEAKYTKEYGWEWAYEAGTEYWVKLEKVKAWMPLPKPYVPQESEVQDADND